MRSCGVFGSREERGMNEVLRTILSLSLSGSLLILFLLLCSPLYRRRISRQWQYYIWLVVILRLLVPVTVPVSLAGALFERTEWENVRNMEPETSDTAALNPAVWDNTVLRGDDVSWPVSRQDIPAAESEITADSRKSDALFHAGGDILWFLWLTGALLLLMRRITAYQSFVKYVRAGRREISDIHLLETFSEIKSRLRIAYCVELYENPQVSTPMLMGLRKPCIVLPTTSLTEEEFSCTVRHELIHCKRLDLLYKWLMQITLCLHWFNPLVWLMEKRLEHACELSCDEALISMLDDSGRRVYGDTLLHAAKTGCGCRHTTSAVTLCEEANLLKERLGAIMDYRKMTKGGVCALLLLTIVLCCGFTFTGAYTQNAYSYGKEDAVELETLEFQGNTYYLVFDEAQLRAIGTGRYGMDKSYMQQADIRLSGEEWIPIGTMEHPFTGSYNGNGFEIAGLTMTDPEAEHAGLFGVARDADIYNIMMRDASLANMDEDAPNAPVLAVGLGNTACYDITVLETGNLAQFLPTFWGMEAQEQKAWLERFYEDGEIATFATCLNWLEVNNPLVSYFAQRAYMDGETGFFSVLINRMGEDELEEWAVRAIQDREPGFAAMLHGRTKKDDELDEMQKKLDEEQDREYQSYGITHEGKNWYYQGQLIGIILENEPGKSFYKLDMNPQGTINIHIIRDENWKIQSLSFMTEEERMALFGQ